mmetsp:Transcript_32027/g.38789  ORF Transcript_32027/g.38789 Transcript_32027/m.38789 type:complete len:148 (-) Transcript_32027:248-691(-)
MSLFEIIGDSFLATDGTTVIGPEAFNDAELVGLYFSAHWCPPCRNFTPQLASFHEELTKQGRKFPIVFGSSDSDQQSFQDYFKDMPWFAFKFKDEKIEELKKKYGVSGIPWLVVLDKEGNLVLNEADEEVPQGTPVFNEWVQKVTVK